MRRLLMISYPFPPNASAGSIRSERFAKYLIDLGWAVDVITIKPRLDIFKDTNRLNNLGKNINVYFTKTLDLWIWLRDRKPKTKILRFFRSALMNLFSFPDHMLFWVPFAVEKGIKIYKQRAIDVIYTTSPPHSTHLAGLLLSRITKKPWVADFRDPWTLKAYHRNNDSLIGKFLLKIERYLEKVVLKNASKIFANTKSNKLNLLNSYSFLNKNKVIHLPNSWEEFPEYIKSDQKNNCFTIVHAGTFYPKFKPYALLYALSAWRKEYQDFITPFFKKGIQVILLGATDLTTRKVIKDLQIEDIVTVKPWVSLDEARQNMRKANLLWATLGTGKESSSYIPSKLFEYIAAEKPIIGFFPDGEAADLIKFSGVGIVFNKDDIRPVINTLSEVINTDKPDEIPWYRPDKDFISSLHISEVSSNLSYILCNVVNEN